MDYEEKYKEALERCREFYAKFSNKQIKEEIEEIFPELKESEGEQHRKWILEYLYDGLRKSDEQFKDHFKAAITWLEKQGEQKPLIKKGEKYLCIKAQKRRTDFYVYAFTENTTYVAPEDNVLVDNQGHSWDLSRQKPEWIFERFTICQEQKTADWSEKYIADVFEMVGLAKIVREQENDALTEALQSAMIELAKYSVLPQPRQEWSEEDERIKDNCISFLGFNKENSPQAKCIDECINWLKSLNPQSHWKPSDGQMVALNNAILLNEDHYNGAVLSTLREQLNKLREG